jgi:membrane-associated phospholipid phosphatase
MYSRVLIKCHTLQQTIVGSLIGIAFAFLLFKYKNKIKKELKKYKNSDLYLLLISSIILFYLFYKNF